MVMQNEDKIISASVDTFLEKATPLTISIKKPKPPRKRTILERLLRKPVPDQELKRTFNIYPCVAANMGRIAGTAVLMEGELNGGTAQEVYLPLIVSHKDQVVYTIAAGIQNDRHEPDPALITFIEDNFDAFDMADALAIILKSEWLESFFNSIVLIKGTVTILKRETSPIDRSE